MKTSAVTMAVGTVPMFVVVVASIELLLAVSSGLTNIMFAGMSTRFAAATSRWGERPRS